MHRRRLYAPVVGAGSGMLGRETRDPTAGHEVYPAVAGRQLLSTIAAIRPRCAVRSRAVIRPDSRPCPPMPREAITMLAQPPSPSRRPPGRQRSCTGWHQEAALRMLMNNLDPDVAERPEDLIVYGGAGKAARDWTCLPSHRRHAATARRTTRRCSCRAAKPVGVFRTHEDAPRVLIANAHLVPRWATWDEFRRLEALGLTMYGQMTAGSWIYIGTQGILQGTYETLCRVRPPALRRHPGRTARRHRRAGRHGRRAAARGDDERRRLPGGRGRSRRASSHRLADRLLRRGRYHRPRRRRSIARRERSRDGEARSRHRARRQHRRRDAASWSRAAIVPGRGHRSDRRRTICGSATSRRGCQPRRSRGAARARSGRLRGARARLDGRSTSRRCSRCRRRDRSSSTTATTCADRWPIGAGSRARVRDSRFRAGVHPSAVLPRRGTVPLGRALRRSRGHRASPTRRCCELFPQAAVGHALDREGARAREVPGPARAHLLARIRRARRGGRAVQLAGEDAAASTRRS